MTVKLSSFCAVFRRWLCGEDSEKAARTLHTQYHAVEKTVTALNIKW